MSKSKLSLSTNLAQKLKFSPQLHQAIKILQMTRQELEQLIRNEMEENPLLESDFEQEEKVSSDVSNEDQGSGQQDSVDKERSYEDVIDWDQYANAQEYSDLDKKHKDLSVADHSETNYDDLSSQDETLTKYLMWQSEVCDYDKTFKSYVQCLINYTETTGWLNESLEVISKNHSIELEKLEKALLILHTFEPSGVGARDLKETLKIQVRALFESDPYVEKVIDQHLENINTKKYQKIADDLDLPLSEVLEISKLLGTLSPFPGRNYASLEQGHVVTPELKVTRIGDDWILSDANPNSSVQLKISDHYRDMLQGLEVKKIDLGPESEAKKYLQDKLKSAVFLIRAVDHRQKTLYQVGNIILRVQKEFFHKGDEGLKPMTMMEVASELGVHQSTVSRAINGKYIQTPMGTYNLKHFFCRKVKTTNEFVQKFASKKSVMKKIKQLIEQEPSEFPLSDAAIVALLEKQGLSLNRRSVGKYRLEMGIEAANKRKK